MPTSFVHLAGSKLKMAIGLESDSVKYEEQYMSVTIGLAKIYEGSKTKFSKDSDKLNTTKLSEGVTYRLVADGIIKPYKCLVFISPNQMLTSAGQVSYQSIREHSDEDGRIILTFTPTKEIDVSKLPWLVRLCGVK